MQIPRFPDPFYRNISRFNRKFFDSEEDFTVIGNGSLGGKAQGLAFINEILRTEFEYAMKSQITVNIPKMAVIGTDVFDTFMKENDLHEIAYSNFSDSHIANRFQKAEIPTSIVGDLRALVEKIHVPLAVRSSSMLEDMMYEPFAGIYSTKMTPNNQPDADTRFKKLAEAIKFVYASTFFKNAKNYMRGTTHKIEDEKMAVIIQEVVGLRHANHFYPDISGVIRTYNFYPSGRSKPEEGVVNLALGLGKTIVDGGLTWFYSPSYPRLSPPYNSINDMMKNTQLDFWSINMGKPPEFHPTKETEYLLKMELLQSEKDNTLKNSVSTYDPGSDRIYPGLSSFGPKVLNFAPILDLRLIPLNDLIADIIKMCKKAYESDVEIEFALTISESDEGLQGRFGLLQVRPMVVSDEVVEINSEEMEMEAGNLLVASENILGNGTLRNIQDIMFVKPETFDLKDSQSIADEISKINAALVQNETPYVLMGFGRWGTSDEWAGIPVNWGDICGAKVIVECALPGMHTDLSQGSHFFHNVTSFQVSYFSLEDSPKQKIDWDWLNTQETIEETNFIKHVRLSRPMTVKVDGRNRKGLILK